MLQSFLEVVGWHECCVVAVPLAKARAAASRDSPRRALLVRSRSSALHEKNA